MAGCSAFQLSEGKTSDSAFYSSATSVQNPDVVPAEIALDIIEVMRGGKPRATSVGASVVAKAQTAKKEELTTEPETEPLENAPEWGERIPANSPVAKNEKPAKRRPTSSDKYTVKNGDTLMKISFEKFGNVYRWREIYDTNKNSIADYNNLKPGTLLTIKGIEYVVILRNGKPYLIRRNDSLVKISNSLYGTPAGWKGLWANNLQLIHDPNKIYAGFTMYYLPLDKLPTKVSKIAYSNRKQQDKLKYIQSLRKPATSK